MKNTCIILAGGLGTRLREAVPNRPKCLAPIGKYSFLEIQLALLAKQGVDDFVLSLGYLADQVEAEVERLSKQFSIRCVVEASPLGTGGAIAYAMAEANLDEALVTNGDTFLGGDLRLMFNPLSFDIGEQVRMAVINVEDRGRYGGVQLDNRRVSGFVAKGQNGSGSINAGFYRLSSKIFSNMPTAQEFSFESIVLPILAESGKLFASPINGAFTDIGVPSDYYRFCQEYG
jgi:D-glycero-alpha-D-manno-heptose 1-phosphate guanylyltransferase